MTEPIVRALIMAISTEVITAVGSALLGAASGGGVAWWIHHQDSYAQHAQKTRDVLIQLIDLRGQAMDSQGISVERMELLVQKRAMLLSQAETFAACAAKALRAHDWITLGTECQANRDFKDARAHLERAVECSVSEDLLTQVIARRFLASYYYAPGRFHDAVAGARIYAEAVALTRADDDPYLRYHTGLSFAAWAGWAGQYHEDDWERLLAEAKDCYTQASEAYPPAREALADLERRAQAGFANVSPPGLAELDGRPLSAQGTS